MYANPQSVFPLNVVFSHLLAVIGNSCTISKYFLFPSRIQDSSVLLYNEDALWLIMQSSPTKIA